MAQMGTLLLLTWPRDATRDGVTQRRDTIAPQTPPGSARRAQPLPHPHGWGAGEGGIQPRLVFRVFQVAELPAKEMLRSAGPFCSSRKEPAASPQAPAFGGRAGGGLRGLSVPGATPLSPPWGDTAPSRPLPADGLSRGQRDGAASGECLMPSPGTEDFSCP